MASPRTIVGNRGDLLSRFGILDALVRRGAEPAVFAHRASDLGPLKCETLSYGPFYNFWPRLRGWLALRRSEAIVWTGGLDLQDDSSLLKLLHTWLTFLTYRLLGKRIYAVMQGAGPLNTRAGRWLARRIVSLTDKFLARDTGTCRLLEQLGAGDRVVPAHDGIFLEGLDRLRADPSEIADIERIARRCAGRPIIGVNVRMWFHFRGGVLPYAWAKRSYAERARASMDRLIEATIDLVRQLRERHDARVVLISMYEPDTHPWEDDFWHLQRVKQALADDDEVVLLREPLAIGGFCELLRRLDLMIGSRLHSTLAALRFGVPAVNLAYTGKCRDIFTDLGLADQFVDLESFMNDPKLVARLASRLLHDTAIATRIRAIVRSRVANNEAALDRVFRMAVRTKHSNIAA